MGVKLPFMELPPRCHCDNYDTADCEAVYAEFRRLIALGYLRRWDDREKPAEVVSPVSAVPKKLSNKKRVVIDMSASGLNERIRAGRFSLPSVEGSSPEGLRAVQIHGSGPQGRFLLSDAA